MFGLDGGKFEGTFPGVGNGFSATTPTSPPNRRSCHLRRIGGRLRHWRQGAGTDASPSAHVASISGGHGNLTVTLSCPAGGAACGTATVQATVTEHLKGGKVIAVSARKGKKKAAAKTKTVVIASGGASLGAGASKTLTLKLNAAGSALLAKYGKLAAKVTVSVGGKTLDAATVTVRKAGR